MSADKHPEHHKRDLLLSDRISQSTATGIWRSGGCADFMRMIVIPLRERVLPTP